MLERWEEVSEFIQAVKEGLVCCCNSFRSYIVGNKKVLSVITDSRFQNIFSKEELNVIEKLDYKTDKVLGEGLFNDDKTILLFNEPEIITLSDQKYFITFDINTQISAKGNTLGIACADSSYFICPYPVKVLNDNFPFQSELYGLPVIDQKITSFYLGRIVPNPFNSVTKITYRIPYRMPVKIQIINTSGQTIKILTDSYQAPGDYSITWKGRNDNSIPVKKGIYFLKINAGDKTGIRKIIYSD